ncbi:MAG: LPS-assembly protein LptD [Pseudobdellovibrio sp.]
MFNLVCIFLTLSIGLSTYAQQTSKSANATNLATAKISDFIITADTLSRDLEKGTVTIDGKVQIIYKQQYFYADRAEINLKKKHAYFEGHVKIQTLDYEIGGDEINLDYFANQAMIINGYVQSNNVKFQGALIEQRGPNIFYVADADYTTCTNCPATWSFNGSKIKAELGGYAFLKNTFLKVSGIPIFWLPYLVVPLKNERQSGFLFPEFGFIRNRGLVLSESFFWAISRSQDMTFTLKNYELGGLKQLVEYRYALSDESYGQYNLTHFNDSTFRSNSQYYNFMTPNERNSSFRRWSVQGYTKHQFSDDLNARFKVNQISDLQYPKDFYDEFKSYADGSLENSISLSKNTDTSLLQINAFYYKHLLESNPFSTNDSAVHKLPEVQFNLTTQQILDTPLYFKFDSQYDYFYRKRKWDDISLFGDQKYVTNTSSDPTCDNKLDPNCNSVQDGVYNESNDLLRTGQRLNYKATFLTQTFSPIDYINISPELSYNETHYMFSEGSKRYNTRRYALFNVVSRSRLYNIYDSDNFENKYKHEFIPELTYSNIPWIEQEENAFFGNIADGEYAFSSRNNVSDADLKSPYGLQYDYNDRIYDRHLVTLSLLNRVIKKRMADNSYHNLFDFRLSQSYDLYQLNSKYGNSKQPLSDLSGIMNLHIDEFTLTNQFNYYPYISATNSSTSLSYLNQHQQYFKIGYISKRTEDPKTDDLLLALGFVTKYINVLSGFVIDTSANRDSSTRMKKFSLITQLKPPGECWAVNFYRDQKVGLEAEWKVRFDFSFDGKPPKVIPPDELNIR